MRFHALSSSITEKFTGRVFLRIIEVKQSICR
jgi:hypothetical protein